MLTRALIALAVVALAFAVWRLWKRAPHVPRLDLAELGAAPGPVIVQFSTRYCSPCKTNASALERFARDASVGFVQVDLGDRPDLAGRYGIRSVPTIVVAGPDGRVVGTWTSLPENGEIRDAALRVAAGAV